MSSDKIRGDFRYSVWLWLNGYTYKYLLQKLFALQLVAQETAIDKLNAGHSIPVGLTLMAGTARPFTRQQL